MSPDIEWHVGENADQETIAHTSTARRSRRRWWAVIIAIGLGVGLGVLYRSIPAPPAKPIEPTPAPAVIQAPLLPLPTPASAEPLLVAIQCDAQHLASLPTGDRVTFNPALARLPQAYADWYAALQNAYGRWGDSAYGTLYTIFETGTLSSGAVWVKLGQFRNGDFYRQTRFYRQENDRWIWTLPDLSFWSGITNEVTSNNVGAFGPISIQYPIEDEPHIAPIVERFARASRNLCESLQCPSPGLTLSITIQPALMQPIVNTRSRTLVIDLPSPRVVGYYEDANALGDPFVSMAYDTLIDSAVQLASGDYARWELDRGGSLFLQAIATWQRARLLNRFFLLELFYHPRLLPPSNARLPNGQPISLRQRYVDLLRGENLVPLVSLWDWPTDGHTFGLLEHVAVAEAESIVIFIEERYGKEGVVRFLNSLGKAHSLDEAIAAALPVSFGEFNRQWLRWIAGE